MFIVQRKRWDLVFIMSSVDSIIMIAMRGWNKFVEYQMSTDL